MNAKQQAEYGDRKLAHYNAWLLDPARPAGTVYPGFPEDAEAPKAKRVAKVTDKVAKKGKVPAAKTPRARKGGTKLEKAKALFKANMKLSRENMIGLFMEQLSMTKAGATTYFYAAQK